MNLLYFLVCVIISLRLYFYKKFAFLEVNFYWVRDNFPNFVEEDQRVFVSQDGNLYFSSLEKVDAAYYSCNAQSRIASNGRTGPFFKFTVEPACEYASL